MSDLQLLDRIGSKIRVARLERKMTQDDLGVKCNLEKARLSKIENGLANPTIRSLYRICQALEISIADLFRE